MNKFKKQQEKKEKFSLILYLCVFTSSGTSNTQTGIWGENGGYGLLLAFSLLSSFFLSHQPHFLSPPAWEFWKGEDARMLTGHVAYILSFKGCHIIFLF